ncbi:MAG TPA: tyrosine--tRNA ligase [Candidatus Kapabacteria bacterium]|nr:tyrosine--tRNA ligase [Candidatus Kapabacteria bacterium]
MDVIREGIHEILPEDELVRKIEYSAKKNIPLNVKLGADPSRPDLHLGHAVVLRKMRQFQDIGHQAILIIGDFTGMIGDPTGRSKTRPSLTLEETRRNGQSYFEQATKILSGKRMQMMYNSEWLSRMSFVDVVYLSSKYTVARMLERDDFEKRYKAGESIGIHEFLYPLAQAMDSVAVHSDIELGGTDQKFNLLVAREIQREYGLDPQAIVLMPILEGTDGKEKMSKSLGNYIAITDPPSEMYGKTLSIPDTLIERYFSLGLFAPSADLKRVKEFLAGSGNPRDVKRELARRLVTLYHNEEAAKKAEEAFDELFVKKEIPDDIRDWTPAERADDYALTALIAEAKLVESGSEARRMIEQGGVSVNGEKIKDIKHRVTLSEPLVIKVGKRKFVRVLPHVS